MSANIISNNISVGFSNPNHINSFNLRFNALPRINPRTKYHELTHLELVKVCGESSQHPAWEEFHRRFDRLIKIYVKKAWKTRMMNGDMSNPVVQDLLNDMAQDVYVKLLEDEQQALRNFKGLNDTSFLAYLTRISINIVAEYFRKQLAEKRRGQTVSMDLLLNDTVNEHFSCRSIKQEFLSSNDQQYIFDQVAVNQLITMLDESLKGQNFLRDKQIFQLYLDGFTSDQIADLIGVNIKSASVESIIRRIRRKLKVLFQTRMSLDCQAA